MTMIDMQVARLEQLLRQMYNKVLRARAEDWARLRGECVARYCTHVGILVN